MGFSKIAGLLSSSKNRAWVHAAILLVGAGMLLAGVLGWEIFQGTPKAPDKAVHYQAGRLIAATTFYLAYICIIVRVLLVGRGRGSMTRVLLWIPTMVAGGLIAAIVAAFAFAVGKEVLDIGGVGSVEWLDVDATLDGALTMMLPVAFIMALTPILIPLDILMQLPKLMLSDVRTGIKTLDNYIREQKSHSRLGQPADVLVVEDDIVCATTVMNFCRNIGFRCYHVSTISEADEYLHYNISNIRFVVLDNFVRVDNYGNNMTGTEWLTEINAEFPLRERSFLVVITSGHTELLGEAASLADLVLQKPWVPQHLVEFLKNKGVLKKRRVDL